MRGIKWPIWVALLVVFGGCASPSSPEPDDALSIDECVSERGQFFLTFCASKDAAEMAKRQHTIERGADDDNPPSELVSLPVEGAPVRGERDAPITVHLFGDLHCDDCRAVYERLVGEVEHRPGQMRLVFRHAPIDDAGETAARAAIAASEQGKFFEFVDGLYDDYDKIAPSETWPDIAVSVGLDVDKWEEDRRMSSVDAILEHDAIHGEAIGLVEAPTFFINGVRKVGGIALHEVDEVVDRELEHVEAMQEAGLSGADISWRRILHNYQSVDWQQVEQARTEMESELTVSHIPLGASPQKGASKSESLVTVVVFADFQCVYCAEAARTWRELVYRYEDAGLRVVYKHFPLSINEDSMTVAAASVLADQVGRFWDFHDALYFGDVPTDMRGLRSKLEHLGWSGESFVEAVESDEIQSAVDADRQLGAAVGVEGTPTFYINGIQLMGVLSADQLAPLIEDQIALAQSIRELTGNHGDALYRDMVETNRGH